jgi:hypothetical protein
LRFELGDGVGEVVFRFGEAVGDGVGVDFLADRFRCFRAGVGVGDVVKNFLIFLPNGSSAAPTVAMPPNNIARIKSPLMVQSAQVIPTRPELAFSPRIAQRAGGSASPKTMPIFSPKAQFFSHPAARRRWTITAPTPSELLC